MNDGGPAFPEIKRVEGVRGTKMTNCGGMSLREWFAGMAMQGILKQYSLERGGGSSWIAEHAYEIADAMLAQREKGQSDA